MRSPALLAACLMASLVAAAHAEEVKSGALTVQDAWARASSTPTASAYLTIRNDGDADRLVGVSTDRASSAMLHTSQEVGGVMKMRPVEGVDVPAHGSVTLRPGGLHIMLMGLKGPLKVGDKLPLALRFQKAGPVSVTASVVKAGATSAPGAEGEGMMNHQMMDHQHMMSPSPGR